MYAGKQPLLVVNQKCSCTVTQVTAQLHAAGFSVMQSFDLFSTRERHSKHIRQIVVLLVYQLDGPPSTLILDGNDTITFIFLENNLGQSSQSQFFTLLSQIQVENQPIEEQLGM